MGRRLDASRTTRSLPSRSPSATPDLAADEQPRQVVPAVEGAAPDHQVGVRARPRPRRSTRGRPRRGPGTAPSPGESREIPRSPRWRLRGPRTRTARWPARPSPPRRRGRRRSAARWPGCVTTPTPRTFGVEHADARGVEGHAPVRIGGAVDRVDHREQPGGTVAGHPRLLGEHGQAGAVQHRQGRPVGGQVEPVLPRLSSARPPVLEHVERAAHGATASSSTSRSRTSSTGDEPYRPLSPRPVWRRAGRPRPLGFPSCGCH